jgi:hypothetical protein
LADCQAELHNGRFVTSDLSPVRTVVAMDVTITVLGVGVGCRCVRVCGE